MRIWLTTASALSLVLFAGSVQAGETFRTQHGKEFHDCQVLGRDAYGVTFRHAGGIARLGLADLNGSLQERFRYDKVEAKRFVDAHRPKRQPQVKRSIPVPQRRVATRSLSAGHHSRYSRGHHSRRNPYSLHGSLSRPQRFGYAQHVVQPYFYGAFGSPQHVRSIPGGFFTRNTLRVGPRPLLDSPVAPGMTSYNQFRDARVSAARATKRVGPVVSGGLLR